MLTATEALERLREGNERFVAHGHGIADLVSHTHLAELVRGQEPFAIVLGCSDSRVPAEVVFDQGLGDLFVIRVAGNIAAESQIGSIEYAAVQFGTPLVVVLGHSHCGAVTATLDALRGAGREGSEHIGVIVDLIRPAVEPLLRGAPRAIDRDELIHRAVRENVRTTVKKLTRDSQVLRTLADRGALRIVGAEYALETGHVEFFELA